MGLRKEGVKFGGFYSYIGGHLDESDFNDSLFPEMIDFERRVCAARELFEETNLLVSSSQPSESDLLDIRYNLNFNTNFYQLVGERLELQRLKPAFRLIGPAHLPTY